MYPYHNRIKQRIGNGELIGWEKVKDYPNIGECIVLHFSTLPYMRPIRPQRYGEYMNILQEYEERSEGD